MANIKDNKDKYLGGALTPVIEATQKREQQEVRVTQEKGQQEMKNEIAKVLFGEAKGKALGSMEEVARTIERRKRATGKSYIDIISKPEQYDAYPLYKDKTIEQIKKEEPQEEESLKKAQELADRIVEGKLEGPYKYTHFHAKGSDTPYYFDKAKNKKEIAGHIFYELPEEYKIEEPAKKELKTTNEKDKLSKIVPMLKNPHFLKIAKGYHQGDRKIGTDRVIPTLDAIVNTLNPS
ncbi:MAG: hypothetical protein ACOC5T_03495 [Elusimicrobiota bacterium]